MIGARPVNMPEMPAMISARRPFIARSMSGTVLPDGGYLITSYGVVIAHERPDGTIWHDSRTYSPTTSRHQRLARMHLTNSTGKVVVS